MWVPVAGCRSSSFGIAALNLATLWLVEVLFNDGLLLTWVIDSKEHKVFDVFQHAIAIEAEGESNNVSHKEQGHTQYLPEYRPAKAKT